jgi:hypothetical protein
VIAIHVEPQIATAKKNNAGVAIAELSPTPGRWRSGRAGPKGQKKPRPKPRRIVVRVGLQK